MPPFGDGIIHAQGLGQGDADLGAGGLGDPAAPFQLAPGHVVFLRADEAKDVLLAAIFADEGGGQAQPTPRLNLRGYPEHRRRQQMHFVIDDQPPVALIEHFEVRELLFLVGPVRQNLVGGHRHRADVLALAGVLGDLIVRQVGLVEDLAFPLLDGGDAGGEDQGGALHECHGGHADDGFAGAAG